MESTGSAPQQPFNFSGRKKGPDSALIGLIAGLVFPVLGIMLLFFFWGDGNFGKYLGMFFDLKNYIKIDRASKVLSLSLIANLIPFYYFLNRKKYQTTKGIILATFLYCVLIVLYKFVWQ